MIRHGRLKYWTNAWVLRRYSEILDYHNVEEVEGQGSGEMAGEATMEGLNGQQ